MENNKIDQFVWKSSDIVRNDSSNFLDVHYLSFIMTLILLKKAILLKPSIKVSFFDDLLKNEDISDSLAMNFKKMKSVPEEVYLPLVNDLKKSRMSNDTIKSFANLFYHLDLTSDELKELATRYLQDLSSNIAAQYRGQEFISTRGLKDLFAMLARTVKGGNYYDPFFGVSSFIDSYVKDNFKISGHEINSATYEAAIAYLFIIDKYPSSLKIGDCLLAPTFDPAFKLKSMDLVLSNPPLNQRPGSHYLSMLDFDILGRFSEGVCRSDLTLNILEHVSAILKESGKGFVVVSFGSLFRAGIEEKIRKHLISEGKIEAVISLPGGLLGNTQVPVAIICLSDKESNKESVKFISAEKLSLKKNKGERILSEEDLQQIWSAYDSDAEIEGFSKIVKLGYIFDNNSSLLPSRHMTANFEFKHVDLEDLETRMFEHKTIADKALMNINELLKGL